MSSTGDVGEEKTSFSLTLQKIIYSSHIKDGAWPDVEPIGFCESYFD